MTRRPSDPSVRSVQEDDMPVRPPRWVGRRVAKISLVALASLILLAGLLFAAVYAYSWAAWLWCLPLPV